MSDDKRTRIRALNDEFRWSLIEPPVKGKVYITDGVAARGEPFGVRCVASIALFEDFTEDIDPHGERAMIRVTVDAVIVWAKIDYFDKNDPDLGAEDPSDLATTERAMTIMLPEEY